MSLAKKTIAAAAWSVSGRFLSRGVDLVTLFVLARLLTPADFGLVAIAMILISIVEAVFELPLAQALMRLDHVTKAHLDTAFTLAMARALVLSALIALLSWPFSILYGDARLLPLVCLLSLAPAVRGLSSPGIIARLKALDFLPTFKMEFAGKLCGCAAAATLALLHSSYWAIVANTLVAPLVMTLLSYVIAPYRPRLTLRERRCFADFLGWASAAQILGAFNWQSDRLILGRLVSRSDVGLFSMASDIAGIPTQSLINPLISPIMAAFSNLSNDRPRLAEAYRRAAAAITLLGLPVLVGLGLEAKPLVAIALGPRWQEAAPLLSMLALQAVLSLLTAPLAPLVMSLGRTDLLLRQNLVETAVKIPLVVAGALWLGLDGVVIARYAGAVAAAISATLIVRRVLAYSVVGQLENHWRQTVSVLLMAGAVLMCAHLVPAHGSAALEVVLGSTVGALVYAVSTIAIGVDLRSLVPARLAAVFDVGRRWRRGAHKTVGIEPSR